MYTNPSNLVKTVIGIIESNAVTINKVVRIYEPSATLTVWAGMRKSLPIDAFPSLEIEPTSGSNQWATTRSQRPRYSFQCTLTVVNANEEYGVEYIASVVEVLVNILTDPQNLQARVVNERKWDPNVGLTDTYILDSFVDSVTYNASKDGTIRTADFEWWATIHEPYPQSHWPRPGNCNKPTVVRPQIITPT